MMILTSSKSRFSGVVADFGYIVSHKTISSRNGHPINRTKLGGTPQSQFHKDVANRGQSLIEKIANRFKTFEDDICEPGRIISVRPAHVMTHDNTAAVMQKFKQFFPDGKPKVASPQQPVFCLDHNIQDKSEVNLKKYESIAQFAKEQSVDFYPAGRGIGHQVICEEGYAWPLTMVVASDSHSNMYGGLGCLGTPMVRTDAAAIWATGNTWWQVPPISKVEFHGKLKEGVTGKDVIITLCGLFNKDQVLNHAVEFTGPGIQHLTIDERLTIANMTTEWGALAGVFPVDHITLQWLNKQSEKKKKNLRLSQKRIKELENNMIYADQDAKYENIITLDLSSVTPHVSGPNHVKVMRSVSDIEKEQIKIHKAYIVSCVNSRVDDLASAARVIKGKKIADHVQLYIAAASNEVQQESEERGDWQTLIDGGARVLPPGCGPCIGLGAGLLQDGEVGISATNRNFKGRMGSKNAQAYLASPAVVAASALKGYISNVDGYRLQDNVKYNIENPSISQDSQQSSPKGKATETVATTTLIKEFPKIIKGEIVFCHQDNLNTDGIYPGKYTYKENISPEQQAEVAMENYDPEFSGMVKKGHILVGGFNFGTGSSREQAATALKYKGIPLVLAGSFSETYKRNAINNGLLAIEVPQLVKDLKTSIGTNTLTKITGIQAFINFEQSTIELSNGNSYSFTPLGKVAQELIVLGGLEQWVLNTLSSTRD